MNCSGCCHCFFFWETWSLDWNKTLSRVVTTSSNRSLSFIFKLHGVKSTHLHTRAPWVCTCRARGPSLLPSYLAALPSLVLWLQHTGGQLAFFRQWKNGGNEDAGNRVKSVGVKADKMIEWLISEMEQLL